MSNPPLLADTSLADELGHSDPYKNLMGHVDANDEWRKEHPQVVDQLFKTEEKTGKINLLRSAGPVSDAFMLNTHGISVICGPVGSGKTIASVKKGLVEAQRIYPGADGVRNYKLGCVTQKYDNQWKATIPSHWKIFRKDLPGSSWSGASPRQAQHILRFEDGFGEIRMIKDFFSFGEEANEEDLRGLEYTDIELIEIDTLPHKLLVGLGRAVGREPPQEVIKRTGRRWGALNAPTTQNWTYKFFWEEERPPYKLFMQPGGMEPDAENLEAHGGRGYYEQMIAENWADQYYVRRMVHAIPGPIRATNMVYDKFNEMQQLAKTTLIPDPVLPVIVGIDGGFTPAAVYTQEMPDGQFRVYAEIALERGGMEELAKAMLALEARRFQGCEFRDVCDPAMVAGEDNVPEGEIQQISRGSDRQRLSKLLGRKVQLAQSNDVGRRHDAMRAKIGDGGSGYLLDPSCKGLIRGKRETYQFRTIQGSNDISSVKPTFDTHVADAEQYAAMECGTDAARRRRSDLHITRAKRRDQARAGGRYNPMKRKRG
ncbi:hypothetical protein [Bradyrhizobium sp. 76]|uniref:hypothetical protein n=1 Tax=Bradyrhizobium sp. 76 TaxID=2782680 RepID=UPI001FFB925A|nr:hypothetical protein [Bradyrhizobium sp. 76]MCK1407647.1 hypothetical protein [Bradyrhizobium sp. 76]